MSSAAALEIAEGKDLDLVKIAPGSNPPVCKIMDYGKYRFEQAKRTRKSASSAPTVRSWALCPLLPRSRSRLKRTSTS